MHKNNHHPLSWRAPTGFAATHCVNCKAGWTRTASSGNKLTVCLLDREPVLADMIDCDRYEPKELELEPKDVQAAAGKTR